MLLSVAFLSLFNLFLRADGSQVPCGTSLIDTGTQSCCMNFGGQPPFTPFDSFTEFCCEGAVFSSFQGDEDLVCCGGMVQPNPMFKECCGNELFDPQSEGVCCNGTLNPNATFGSNCCGNLAIDSSQGCCNGTPIGDGEECCGGATILTNTSVCCRNTITPMTNNSLQTSCCEQDDGTFGLFDFASELCCNGLATPLANPSDTECCGNTTLNPENQICCSGEPAGLGGVDTESAECCGTSVFNNQTQICCFGVPQDIPDGSSPDNVQCCGDGVISLSEGLCCNDALAEFGGISNMTAECCGANVIDGNSTKCCGGESFEVMGDSLPSEVECCSPEILDQGVCCDGRPFPSSEPLACCGSESFSTASQDCCGGTTIFNTTENQCCGVEVGSVNQTCCNGNLLEEDQVCCGTNVLNGTDFGCCTRTNIIYPLSQFKCCGDFLVSVPSGLDPDALTCCTTVTNGFTRYFPRVFDPENEFCCSGRTLPLPSNLPSENADCCGPFLFDKTLQRCCRNRVFDINSNNPRCRGVPLPPQQST